ncbi:hypothetical protein AAFF_G00213000 [Aldrovandia affinis]|uniref:Uncharacterized protein n=1 Tax=Aldrovandia affinis TaxID=143900 RepID=A0AAD7RJJ6_9TELE|nr:hypothetical protein AAFF_G00213000 [Aldrovandia affinis]
MSDGLLCDITLQSTGQVIPADHTGTRAQEAHLVLVRDFTGQAAGHRRVRQNQRRPGGAQTHSGPLRCSAGPPCAEAMSGVMNTAGGQDPSQPRSYITAEEG